MLNLLKRFSGAYRRYFFIGPLAKLVEACFDLITPLVVASMIDNGVGARDMGSVVRHGHRHQHQPVAGVRWSR